MSYENRKSVYDKLVALGDQHYHRLSDKLKAEFGDPKAHKPKAKAKPKLEEPKKELPVKEKPKDGS
tara:strand:- start:803 stop:1000 length:198 start_codon:yes stop_codon:yes gene_type:complete